MIVQAEVKRDEWEVLSELDWKKILKEKCEPFARKRRPIARQHLFRWVNSLMASCGGQKVGSIIGYRDQWLIRAHLNYDTIKLGFCQGRNEGRIKSFGGYPVSIYVGDCRTTQDIDFKWEQLGFTRREEQNKIKELKLALRNSESKSQRKIVARRLVWLGLNLDHEGDTKNMTKPDEIAVAKEKVTTALQKDAIPSAAVCALLRDHSEATAEWLDKTYLEYKRPELVGDDKDGLTQLINSGNALKEKIKNARGGKEMIECFREVKGLDPLNGSRKEINEESEEEGRDENDQGNVPVMQEGGGSRD
jgi:hypothetical protein